MNRRSFLTSMLQAGVASMALPTALTYVRAWRRAESGLLNPMWVTAPYEEYYILAVDPIKLDRSPWIDFVLRDRAGCELGRAAQYIYPPKQS